MATLPREVNRATGSTTPPARDPFDIDVKAVVERCVARVLAEHPILVEAPILTEPEPAAIRPTPKSESRTQQSRDDRRRHARVTGRFDGRRGGAVSMPVVIHSLSEVGCFVESLNEEQ